MMNELKIGILVPRSRQFAELGFQFIAGIRDAFSAYPMIKYELVVEDIGIEAGKNVVMEKCQKLLLQYQSDLVIAFVGNHVTKELSNYFDSLGKILVITNMGENNIIHPASPFVFDHSMGICNACWEMGHYMAKNGKKRILVTSSFYDSGYGLYGAFVEGVKTGGGEVARLVFTSDIPNEQELSAIETLIQDIKADALYAIYCSNTAAYFLKQYFSNQYLKKFPLYGSPFLLPAKIEDASEYDYTIATPFNNDLAKRPFYLQGSEIAQLLAKSFGEGNPNEIKEMLETAQIESLRGIVEVDTQQHVTTAPIYILHYSAKGITAMATQHKQPLRQSIDREGILSGFTNPYLCM